MEHYSWWSLAAFSGNFGLPPYKCSKKQPLGGVPDVSNKHISQLPVVNKLTHFNYYLCNCGSYGLLGEYDYYGRFCWISVVVEGIFLPPRAFWCLGFFLVFGGFKTIYNSFRVLPRYLPPMLKLINIIMEELNWLNYAVICNL